MTTLATIVSVAWSDIGSPAAARADGLAAPFAEPAAV